MTTTTKPLKKRYRYRIYPTTDQQEALSKVFGCVRYVYNRMLGEIKEARNMVGLITGEKYKLPSHFDMCKHLPFWKKEEDKAWLSEVNSQTLQASLLNLSDAYKNAFKHKKGFPKFKNKFGVQTAEYSNQTYSIKEAKLKLAKIDTLFKVKWSRPLPKEGVTSCTIIRTPSGKYYVSFIVEAQKTATTGQAILGIDAGLTDLFTLSSGEVISNPRHFAKAQKKLAHLQKQHAKKKKGSNNREKARLKVARLSEKTANQRKDHLHKLSTNLVRENQAICVENLKVSNMVRNPHLAKHISDAGWGMFKQMLMQKVTGNDGCKLYLADPFYPSTQLCSCCGKKPEVKFGLGTRNWICTHCLTTHQRDENAAKNLRSLAERHHKTCKSLTENIVLIRKDGLIS